MHVIMSNSLNIEFVQALNPLYAFPIVAVILCALIVYAFGFKSPVQPPSFEGIEEKKTSKKRKPNSKDASKGKVVQNGKLNGSSSNKGQVFSSAKKKDSEKSAFADKPVVEKLEKKVSKKVKLASEKKVNQEKKENLFISHEDTGEDGWVQLISKKGRKSRKKDEILLTENQTVNKPLKDSHMDKSGENTPSSEEYALRTVLEKPIPEKKLVVISIKEDEVADTKNSDKEVIIEGNSTLAESNLEKTPLKERLKSEKLNEETSNKSKKKKKKNAEVINTDSDCIISPSESPAVQVVPEIPLPQTNIDPIIAETTEIITGDEQEKKQESKLSNVVFDELEGLYPKDKEMKKKKRVRRDH